MTNEDNVVHRFEGVVKVIKHTETHTDESDSEVTTVKIVNKLGDAITVAGPRYQLEKVFKKKQQLAVFFHNQNKPLVPAKPTEPIKVVDNKKPTSIPMPKGKTGVKKK